MRIHAFIKKCIKDVSQKITSLPDLGEHEIYCWEQSWPNNSKGFSNIGADMLTTSMSCVISFEEISFVYHDDFAYACKTDNSLKKTLKEKYIPGLVETHDAKITLMQYRVHPFKSLDHTKKKPPLSITSKSESTLEKVKGIVTISVRVNTEKAKEIYESEKEHNDVFTRSGMTFDQWIDHQKWLALRERINKL